MKPTEVLGETVNPDGTVMRLTRRDDEYILLVNGSTLMSSRMSGSEEALATLTCEQARNFERPVVLVGGLGMGFTLRATLDLLPPDGVVVVSELVPMVVEWNRGPLGHLAGHPLRDPRVRVETTDVSSTLSASLGRFDAVLLDVDNGPSALTAPGNARLYDERGIAVIRAALKPQGVLAVWSTREDARFERRLRYAGFIVEVQRLRARLKQGGPHHAIFLARKGPPREARAGRRR